MRTPDIIRTLEKHTATLEIHDEALSAHARLWETYRNDRHVLQKAPRIFLMAAAFSLVATGMALTLLVYVVELHGRVAYLEAQHTQVAQKSERE